MAIEATEFRRRVFASSGGESEDPLSTLPGILESFRRGILLMDRHLAVRFCSARAGTLLGWDPGELVGRPISSCIDGVDLVTVRHECEKVASGHARQSPFVASFRISSGVYQAREVSIDAVGTANEIVGYLLGVSAIEQVRGPRAVYRQLKEEKAEPSVDQNHPDDENPVANDLLSSDLHGTRITRREHEIMLLILKGMSNRQIANHLRIAEVTVKKHLTSVYRKLRISNRKELIVSFSRPGSVS
jgi:DNA-binding CsgD family transcriptional regulator